MADNDAAKEARKAAELMTVTAREASRLVRAMDAASQLERARTAEKDFGCDDRSTARRAVDEGVGMRLDGVGPDSVVP